MANVNKARGLRLWRGGGFTSFTTRKCFVPATDGTALYVGDPVNLAGASDAEGKYPTVTIATAGAGNLVYGVIVSFEESDTDNNNYRTASTARYCNVCVDPHAIYIIQEDSVGGAVAAASVGLNADLVAGTGSTVTGESGWLLDSNTVNTTANLQLRILGIAPVAGNTVATDYCDWLVVLNQITEHAGVAGV